MVERHILATSKEFKKTWKEKGPFKYALTSNEFPPVLLEPEEWIFSDDITLLLKSLMGFDERKMKFVKAPFNPENKKILRPDELCPWKINHFPEEWNVCKCVCFVPEGHLTQEVVKTLKEGDGDAGAKQIETAFFECLSTEIEIIGYLLLKPEGSSKYAAVRTYLENWENDEKEAGLF